MLLASTIGARLQRPARCRCAQRAKRMGARLRFSTEYVYRAVLHAGRLVSSRRRDHALSTCVSFRLARVLQTT